MHVTAIVLAAGRGRRLKSRIPKPLVEINSKPIIIYSLGVFSKHPLVTDIVVAANARNLKGIFNLIIKYKISKILRVVKGGRRRQDSVRNALKAVDRCTDLVMIHDGARPFIDKKLVSSLIREAKKNGAAIAGVPVKATIKSVRCQVSGVRSKPMVEKTLNRQNLWEIQTPQVFKKDVIVKAYKRFGNIDATDDAMLVEKLGAKVSVVFGSYRNIKITTPEDLTLAEAIAEKWNTK